MDQGRREGSDIEVVYLVLAEVWVGQDGSDGTMELELLRGLNASIRCANTQGERRSSVAHENSAGLNENIIRLKETRSNDVGSR